MVFLADFLLSSPQSNSNFEVFLVIEAPPLEILFIMC